jgi:anthranilate synthase/aminodeoxychorismate synthase-like glutamine amidotransferase
MSARLLLIDNYDSFTYNLVQAFMVLGAEVLVHRNDQISVEEARALKPTHLCISPGPGTPADSGVSMRMIERFAGRIPVLGVCLGHQAIGQHFGGRIVRTPPVHGKTCAVDHDGSGIFAGLPSPFTATRYQSLAVAPESVPEVLIVNATAADETVQGFRHRDLPIHGVQFHPESIASEHGHALLASFLELAKGNSIRTA